MPLRDVADFVRHHAGQFRLGLGRKYEPRVHADKTTGQRKRVQHRIAYRKEYEIERARRADRHQLIPEMVQILGGFGVGQIVGITPDLKHDLLAELSFGRRRQLLAAGIAQRRQIYRLRERGRRVQNEAEEGDDEQSERLHVR